MIKNSKKGLNDPNSLAGQNSFRRTQNNGDFQSINK